MFTVFIFNKSLEFMNLYKKVTSVSLLVVSVYSTAYIGFHLGKLDERSNIANNLESGGQPRSLEGISQNSASQKTTAANTPSSIVLLPVDLAKAKGVPELVGSPQGDYTLVSVVEGAQMNQQLTENLQLVTAQRQQLANLAHQFDKSPENAIQQKELIAGQINEVRMALTRNLRVMAKSYSYSLNNVYLRVPHAVTLLAVSEAEDGKILTEVAHSFDSAAAYLEFQKKNDAYQRMKLEFNKAQATSVQVDEKTAEVAEANTSTAIQNEATAKSQAELSDMQSEMIRLYKYDPERQYLLQYEKTAFYARPAQS